MEFEPIGFVKSPIKEPTDEKWGSVKSEIHVNQSLSTGLKGLRRFSHTIIVFYMHKSTFTISSDLVRRPRNLSEMPQTGIFAQRAKHRPNPIGITSVEIVSVNKNVLTVNGLDAIDGTPVLDIKPYVSNFDKIENATIPEWVERLMKGYFS